MKSKKTVWILVGVFVLLLAVAGGLYAALRDQAPHAQLQEQTETSGGTEASASPAPDFTVLDQEGRKVKLSDFKGKPVILNFWASWCGPCKSEMPDFQRMYDAHKEDVVFLLVNLTDGKETVKTAQEYVQSQFFTFPIYFDTENDAASKYGIYSVPQTFFIDASGNLQAYWQGAASMEVLQKGLEIIQK